MAKCVQFWPNYTYFLPHSSYFYQIIFKFHQLFFNLLANFESYKTLYNFLQLLLARTNQVISLLDGPFWFKFGQFFLHFGQFCPILAKLSIFFPISSYFGQIFYIFAKFYFSQLDFNLLANYKSYQTLCSFLQRTLAVDECFLFK